MRIKFENDEGISSTPCPLKEFNTVCWCISYVGSWMCAKCEHYRGTEGDEVICEREEE